MPTASLFLVSSSTCYTQQRKMANALNASALNYFGVLILNTHQQITEVRQKISELF